jgi:hypothetical protein
MRGKLLILTVVPVMAIGCLAYIAYTELTDMSEKISEAATIRLPIAQSTGQMESALNGIGRWIWATYVIEGDVAQRKFTLEKGRAELKRFKENETIYLSKPRPENMKELFKDIEVGWPKAEETINEIFTLLGKHNARDNEEAKLLFQTKLRQQLAPISKRLDEMAALRLESSRIQSEKDVEQSEHHIRVILAIGLFSSVGMLIFGLILSARLTKSLMGVTLKIADSRRSPPPAPSSRRRASRSPPFRRRRRAPSRKRSPRSRSSPAW